MCMVEVGFDADDVVKGKMRLGGLRVKVVY